MWAQKHYLCCHVHVDTVVYYESIKREVKKRPTYECRGDERLKTKPEESTLLVYTGLLGELEHRKIKTRLIDEMFVVYYESIKRELKLFQPVSWSGFVYYESLKRWLLVCHRAPISSIQKIIKIL